MSFILGNGSLEGYTPGSTGIINLEENCEVIYGAQQLTGKILSGRNLAPVDRLLLTPLSLWQSMCAFDFERSDRDHIFDH